MRHLRRALVLLLTGCASGGADAPTTLTRPPSVTRHAEATDADSTEEVGRRRRPTALEAGVIRRLAAEAERIRELEFLSDVHVDIEDGPRIAQSLSAQVTGEDVQRTTDVYVALGLLSPDVDVRELLEELLAEQVLGYYDLESSRLVVREEIIELLVRSGGSREAFAARLTLLHELVHALQDQRLGLGTTYDRDLSDDQELGFRGLTEGDAMLAMELYAAELLREPFDASAIISRRVHFGDSLSGNEIMRRAPSIFRAALLGPYAYGVRYAAQLFAEGGWERINEAYSAEPPSFSHVLHLTPDQTVESLEMPAFASLDAAGFEVADATTLGEFEFAVYLAKGLPQDVDLDSARGWRGDSLRVYRRNGERLAIWWLAFEDEQRAAAAERATRRQADNNAVRRGRLLMITRGFSTAELTPVHAEVEVAFGRLSAR